MKKVLISIFILYTLNATQAQKLVSNKGSISPLNSQSEMLKLVNEVRKRGCNCGGVKMPPVADLTWDEKLEKAASMHARDIYQRNELSHSSRNGLPTYKRFELQNYIWKSYAENVAGGYDTFLDVLQAWLESPGHCKNLMGNYQDLGIARYQDFWVMDFGTKKSALK
ncbi:MAG: CAP domain-containing protein [Saprospiraceae bacterium]|nr:CAP domain-containing protein [Saprospiraceae bacterium]